MDTVIQNWLKNVHENQELVKNNLGPGVISIVSGNDRDQRYWQDHIHSMATDLFRQDGDVSVISVQETIRKGNFLGTVNAWHEMTRNGELESKKRAGGVLINMVFGEGKRLSPFTQSLANRKSAFLTPLKSIRQNRFLNLADLACLYTNLWVTTLRENGFDGVVVKWGDEAVIPGVAWPQSGSSYREVDAVRFVWSRPLTEHLAIEKEWVAIDAQRGRVVHQFARQPMQALQSRIGEHLSAGNKIAVNLGSLAISYTFLDTALNILADDIPAIHKWVDWDPYVWMALHCDSPEQWERERQHERNIGKTGIAELEDRYPDFYSKISRLRQAVEKQTGRRFSVGVMDFGEPYWIDFGLQIPLRANLESLLEESERGDLSREMFGIPPNRDRNGNWVVRSQIPSTNLIKNSIFIDTVILDESSTIQKGLVVGGNFRKLYMPHGGSALFSMADDLRMHGPRAIAFWAIGDKLTLEEGDRLTTLQAGDKLIPILGNESVIDYSGDNYLKPILGNPLSYEAAAKMMAAEDGRDLEARWNLRLQARSNS